MAILTASLPDALEGLAWSWPVRASGGTGIGYAWSVASGSLPPGIFLPSSGTPESLLAGTPTAAGEYGFTVAVFDPDGRTASRALTLKVWPAGSLYITTPLAADGTSGVPYGQDLDAVGGTGCGYTWSLASGALPPGLAIDGRNGGLTWGTFSQTGSADLSASPECTEISGVAASRKNPGVLWVHDDSGAAAVFYAMNEQGSILQKYSVSIGAQDWEDLCLGPGPDPAKDYLYIGDVGDNGSTRTNCRVVRVEEPAPPATRQATIAVGHEAFWFLYPDGPRNCETVLADWETGTIYVPEKTGGGAGNVYRFPGPMDASWTSTSPATLALVATGTMPATSTGGDASIDARRVVVRGYGSTAWEYARPAGASFDAIFSQTPATLAVPSGQQYEAICYGGDGTTLVSITELDGGSTVPIRKASAAPGPYDTTISGTPGASGTWTFVVRVTDSAGHTATRAYAIVIG
jgi:hypothetical protein